MKKADRLWIATASPEQIAERDRLVIANQGLVYQLVRSFEGRGLDRDDLVGWGQTGLLRAAEKFDPSRGLKFTTYAVYWIRQALYKAVANTARPIRIPIFARKELAVYRKLRAKLTDEWGRTPARAEVLAVMVPGERPKDKIKRDRIQGALGAEEYQISGVPADVYKAMFYESDDPGGLTNLIHDERKEQLTSAFPMLDEKHRAVLTLRYGLNGEPPLGTGEIGRRLGLYWRTTRYLEAEAIAALCRLMGLPEPPIPETYLPPCQRERDREKLQRS
jgi:RNA polymerase primary sigma factor